MINIFELKIDGFRSFAYIENGQCDLVSRNGNTFRNFNDLTQRIGENLQMENAVIDGEIACVDDDSRSIFNDLLFRRRECLLFAFDLLLLNGKDLRALPLIERKRRLKKLLRRKRSRILYVDHIDSRGQEFFGKVCNRRERKKSQYRPTKKPSPPGSRLRIPITHRLKGGTNCSTGLNPVRWHRTRPVPPAHSRVRFRAARLQAGVEEVELKTIKLPNGIFQYDPTKPLGKPGGFGQVFSGKDANEHEVAVKKLHLSAAEAAHRELRIADEFRGHSFEHVIPFIDAGEDADSGDYFVIMPKAERSLEQTIREVRFRDVGAVAATLLQIAKGLQEVADLVHRDLKPDNVLFHQGKWKIADFGIARFFEEATASITLKQCLSPYYAAPEQWRFERATHATDIYALGCIGFCLLTGAPPFTSAPEEQHQRAAVQEFSCADPRIKTLLLMMLRKPPESRPALTRIHELLTAIVDVAQVSSADPLAVIADAAANVAAREQKSQAQNQEQESAEARREQLAKSAHEILADNIERLWGKIHSNAPNARRVPTNTGLLRCGLGVASFSIDGVMNNRLAPGVFRHSQGDVISWAAAIVIQDSPMYQWSASLLYAKPKGASEYRWREVSFWKWQTDTPYEPFAAEDWKDTDLALSNVMHSVNLAFGPVEIDDEKEDEFHARWIWLFANASLGKLRRPSIMPIRAWPPQM